MRKKKLINPGVKEMDDRFQEDQSNHFSWFVVEFRTTNLPPSNQAGYCNIFPIL